MKSKRNEKDSLLGIGLYTVSDVSKLTKVRSQRIRRWVSGYKYTYRASQKIQDSVWLPEIPKMEDTLGLSFNDLMEILFVNSLIELGISLQRIRKILRIFTNLLETDYPFSSRVLLTDGKHFFTEIKNKQDGPAFYDIESKLLAFYDVILPSIVKKIEFDNVGRAARWYPDKDRNDQIVVDPAICFGHPVIEGTRIESAVLADAYVAEDSIEEVAFWYKVDPALVQQAVDFHSRFAA